MYKTEGIILASEKTRESDIALSVFTRDFGKISCVAQGVRKNDSRLRSILQIGAHIDFQFITLRSGRFRLTSPALISLYPRGSVRGGTLPVFLYSLDLCNRIVLEGERDIRLWNLMIKWADHLSRDEMHAPIGEVFSVDIFSRARFWFLGNLLVVLGHVSAEDERYFSESFSSFISGGQSAVAREKYEKIERAYVRYCGISVPQLQTDSAL
ncbi:MAG: DNA repair protein RecO [Patescibacteria group bacterium]